ncbi:UDP-3-O-(3-hydroxymyristoyl)glucosamine N-acyltransferase [Reichenbachiella sp. MALMAid0571]|uniref:UDP-3-O-(3-hydroxymyristoyl)glucosamine N-acyltransferase n=1 Tax=Reichenbachiella sp. MALMAid0571 TaxID=3143939 RepID=UPI0032DFCB78
MDFKISQIAHILNAKVEGNPDLVVNNIESIEEAGEGSISFLSNPKYENFIYTTKASAVIVDHKFEPKEEVKTTLIRVDDPYLSFTALLEEYHKMISFQKLGVEEPSFMGSDSSHGENVYRGAFSYIGNNVTIGNNCKIYPQVYIGDNVIIGDNTILHSGAKIYANCKIGNHCVVHSGAVIGSDGFGFAPQKDSTYKTIPQIGNVVIEDHVDIGANTTIDCATFGSTVIKSGVKLDNLIQIAHNTEIGKNTVIAAQAGISGSTKVGENCVIAGQTGIVGHLKIGDHITIAAQSGITKNINKKGAVMLGSPAFEMADYKKSYVIFKRLPDLMNRIKELEQKILNLPT